MIYISVGSNLGNRLNNIRTSLELIKSFNILTLIKHSIVLETTAIVEESAPNEFNIPYLNMIISGKTNLSPEDLLQKLKEIELIMGRVQSNQKWAPRIIDLDILLFNDLVLDTKNLKIPHSELKNRPFFQNLLSLMGDVSTIYNNQELKNLTNSFTKSFVLNPAFVGVVNLTKDSFSDGGKFDYADDAVKQITKLISDGASVIELGAQSTRPNAEIVGEAEEYNKLNEVLVNIYDLIKEKNIQISIDSFWSSVVLKLIRQQHKISIVNDVRGEFDDMTLVEISENNCKFCIMHSLTAPVNPEIIISQEANPIEVIQKWGRGVLDKLYKIGFSEKDVIIDPGIGFGKSAYQNIKILKEIEKLKILLPTN